MSYLFNSVKVTELSPVVERGATCLGNSCFLGLPSVILLFVKICLAIFPFDVWDTLWVLIRPDLEVSLPL